jgi:hypothetical protein
MGMIIILEMEDEIYSSVAMEEEKIQSQTLMKRKEI